MRGRRRRRSAGVVSIVALVLGWPLPRARADSSRADARDTVAWVDAPNAHVIRLGPDAREDAEVIGVPVSAGARVRVTGPLAAVGLSESESGGGEGDPSFDALTWYGPDELATARAGDVRELYVPVWSTSRILVLRPAAKGAAVRAEIASGERDPMRWHRFDADLADWLSGPATAPAPRAPAPAAEPLVRWIAASRRVLHEADRDGVAAWLMIAWLEASMRHRSLSWPFYLRAGLAASGGQVTSELAPVPDASAWRLARTGQSITIGTQGDVVRIAIRARRAAGARVAIFEGGALSRVLGWSRPVDGSGGAWSPIQWVRVVVPSGQSSARVSVLGGEIAIAAVAYEQRTDVLDALARVRRRATWTKARARGRNPSAVDRALERAIAARADPRDATISALAEAVRDAAMGPEVVALFEGECARAAPSEARAREAALSALHHLERARPEVAGPLARATLDHLRGLAEPSSPPLVVPPIGAGLEDDHRAIAAASAILSGTSAGQAALDEEVYAREHADVPDVAARAHQTYLRELPWQTLGTSAPSRLEVGIPLDTPGDPSCSVRSAHGSRWTRLGEGRTKVDVRAGSGSHARVVLRADLDGGEHEATVAIDGRAVSVHGAAGLSSFVALAEGEHVFDVPGGAPALLARVPRNGTAPCATLRELTRWVSVEREVEFDVPKIGARTVAQLVVRPGPRERRLAIVIGDTRREAWIRAGRGGRIEIPVPAQATTLTVASSEPTELRANVRAPGASPVASLDRRSRASDPDEALEAIRSATRRIRVGDPDERAVARAQRSAALVSIGYRRLAAVGATDVADHGETATGAAPELEHVNLPAGSGPVEPLGFVSRVPPLPVPIGAERDRLAHARALHQRGDAVGVVAELQASTSGDAATLLLGVDAEAAGLPGIAAEAFERVAMVGGTAAPLARAAVTGADVARSSADRARALRAFVLAQIASERGDDAEGAFALLSPAIGWATPSHAESTAGFARVASAGDPRSPTLAERVRSAYVDAPPAAAILDEGRHLEVRWARAHPSRLRVSAQCEPIDGSDEPCAVKVQLDGRAVPCEAAPQSVQSCVLSPSPGPHRIVVRPPEERETIAWAMLVDEDASGGGGVVPARSVTDTFEIDEQRPFELDFAGPTVVRVEARDAAGSAADLDVQIASASGTTTKPVHLAEGVDPVARRVARDGEEPVGAATELRIPVLTPGPARLRIASTSRALLRVRLATAVGLPRRRLGAAGIVPAEDRPALVDRVLPEPSPRAGEDRRGAPLTVSAAGIFVPRSLEVVADDETSGRATGTPYVELRVDARRELATHRAWAALGVFARAREGPESEGATATFDSTPAGLAPGLHGSVLGATQVTKDGERVFGAKGVAQAYASLALTSTTRLVPWASFTVQHADRDVRTTPGADPDVFTPYAFLHPRYATAAVRLATRPFVDAIGRAQVSARSMPDLGAIDRADAQLDADLLPGSGLWPWIGASYVASYRPLTSVRNQGFLRNIWTLQATFWRWVARGHRVSVNASTSVAVDVPADADPGGRPFTAVLGLAYDYTSTRGVRDFPPRLAPFRDRLEEGSGRVQRIEPPADAGWSAP